MCEYCREDINVKDLLMNIGIRITIIENTMSVVTGNNSYPSTNLPINYCPMCGRQLDEIASAADLIQAVANLWVANEGTARGLDWCLPNLKNAVNELIKNQEEEK